MVKKIDFEIYFCVQLDLQMPSVMLEPQSAKPHHTGPGYIQWLPSIVQDTLDIRITDFLQTSKHCSCYVCLGNEDGRCYLNKLLPGSVEADCSNTEIPILQGTH